MTSIEVIAEALYAAAMLSRPYSFLERSGVSLPDPKSVCSFEQADPELRAIYLDAARKIVGALRPRWETELEDEVKQEPPLQLRQLSELEAQRAEADRRWAEYVEELDEFAVEEARTIVETLEARAEACKTLDEFKRSALYRLAGKIKAIGIDSPSMDPESVEQSFRAQNDALHELIRKWQKDEVSRAASSDYRLGWEACRTGLLNDLMLALPGGQPTPSVASEGLPERLKRLAKRWRSQPDLHGSLQCCAEDLLAELRREP